MDEKALELLRRRVLRAREKHEEVIRLVVDEVDQVSITESILRRHRSLKVRADDAVDCVDGRVGTSFSMRLFIARLLSLEARHTCNALVAGQSDAKFGVTGHVLAFFEREVTVASGIAEACLLHLDCIRFSPRALRAQQ